MAHIRVLQEYTRTSPRNGSLFGGKCESLAMTWKHVLFGGLVLAAKRPWGELVEVYRANSSPMEKRKLSSQSSNHQVKIVGNWIYQMVTICDKSQELCAMWWTGEDLHPPDCPGSSTTAQRVEESTHLTSDGYRETTILIDFQNRVAYGGIRVILVILNIKSWW